MSLIEIVNCIRKNKILIILISFIKTLLIKVVKFILQIKDNRLEIITDR